VTLAAGTLDRIAGGSVGRVLDVFLLQHRLDPLVARAGGAELER
jgi:hypothetical protein